MHARFCELRDLCRRWNDRTDDHFTIEFILDMNGKYRIEVDRHIMSEENEILGNDGTGD